jgi:glycosyltransferase involved in cell wall biosynthesis
LYQGYRNRFFQKEKVEGVEVIRSYVYLAPNRGFGRRIVNYLSFMLTSSVTALLRTKEWDVVVATSPQFFAAVSGYWVSRIKGCPFVLDVRDLWPKSIVVLGVLRNRALIRLLEQVEMFLYRQARHVVGTVEGIKTDLVNRGIEAKKITVIPNGVDLRLFSPGSREGTFRIQHNLKGKFIVSYTGTHGLAHALEKVLLAAERLQLENIYFLFVGDGAEKEKLTKMKKQRQIDNVLFLDRQPREKISQLISESDACLVSLKKDAFFSYALPSKLFEIMACARPIILSANGDSRDLVERAGCGIWVKPENPAALAEGVLKLYRNSQLCRQLGENGRRFAERHFDRKKFALQYEEILQQVVKGS